MKNHFTVIIPAFNCEKWAEWNLSSVLNQDYDKRSYNVVYVDDCSTDNTSDVVCKFIDSNDINISYVRNEKNEKALYNLHKHIHQAKQGSIIVTLDGDDAFAGSEVLSKLNELYQDEDCWMTVGSYMQNDNYSVVSPRVSEGYWEQNIRKIPWSFSHLRTFRKELFCKIDKKDLLDVDGEFYKCTFDRAMMYPMVEMSGKDRVRLVNEVLYIYNRLNPISVDRVHRYDQLRIEQQISNKKPYEKLETL